MRPRGRLAGLGFAAKDIYDVAGHVTGCGIPGWLCTHEPAAVAAASAVRETAAGRLDAMLDPGTVLCLPTAPGIAPLKNSPPDQVDQFRGRVLGLTCIAGLCRLPQVTLPLGSLDGCPVGFSVIARRGADGMLLALARTMAGSAGPGPIARRP